MKTPISYYGGKQNLVTIIQTLIPDHNLYAEPFCGGAAVFFNKPKSEIEVLNDCNKELINIYRVVREDFVSLEKEVMITLHSRDQHRKASVIYNNPDMFSEIKRAWAVYVLSSQSFSSMLDGSWGYDVTKNCTTKKIFNKAESFTYDYAIRLQGVQIECTDAIKIVLSRDSSDAFFYCDPPYYNSDCGHYDGYSIHDYENLLNTLCKIEGRFLLSSYHSEILTKYVKDHGWNQKDKDQIVSVANNNSNGKKKVKTEVFTANYEIPLTSKDKLGLLF